MYELRNTESKTKFLCLPNTKKTFFLQKKRSFKRQGGMEDWAKEKKEKKAFNCYRYDNYEVSYNVNKKQANEVKVREKI